MPLSDLFYWPLVDILLWGLTSVWIQQQNNVSDFPLIMLTALINIFNKKPYRKRFNPTYLLALIFGLIHGMGFSNYLKSLLGKSNNVVAELLAFNIGLEFGQIIIVICVLIIAFVSIQILKAQKREWNLFLSSAIFGIALVMAIERLPF